ncbi:MAG: hypothetical protein M1409_05945 [Actinobacteria bacterium]|nr:hypothetical protein [Actinomycetota bacterium]
MKIIVQQFVKIFLFFLYFIIFTFMSNQAYAVTVTSLWVSPQSPSYNTVFSCGITVDVDNHDVACGMVPANAANNTMPWDICPKKNGLGRQDNTTTTNILYKCIANSSTNIPGPGNYKIVAWQFWNDGAEGQTLASIPVNVIAYQAPTVTSIPMQPTQLTVQKTSQNNPTITALPTSMIYPTNPPPTVFTSPKSPFTLPTTSNQTQNQQPRINSVTEQPLKPQTFNFIAKFS